MKDKLIIACILVAIVFLLSLVSKMDKDFVESCTAAGYSQTYCLNAADGK